MKALFNSVEELAKFYNARSGVQFTTDAYEWLGQYGVDFKLDVLSKDEVKAKLEHLNGVFIADYDDYGNEI